MVFLGPKCRYRQVVTGRSLLELYYPHLRQPRHPSHTDGEPDTEYCPCVPLSLPVGNG